MVMLLPFCIKFEDERMQDPLLLYIFSAELQEGERNFSKRLTNDPKCDTMNMVKKMTKLIFGGDFL
ncbi:MAG: hypothetical protein E7655_00790 [Ruminococcaceae bacterium]|nr:hypothetical protein [Oscillospiraceae bacterium]